MKMVNFQGGGFFLPTRPETKSRRLKTKTLAEKLTFPFHSALSFFQLLSYQVIASKNNWCRGLLCAKGVTNPSAFHSRKLDNVNIILLLFFMMRRCSRKLADSALGRHQLLNSHLSRLLQKLRLPLGGVLREAHFLPCPNLLFGSVCVCISVCMCVSPALISILYCYIIIIVY